MRRGARTLPIVQEESIILPLSRRKAYVDLVAATHSGQHDVVRAARHLTVAETRIVENSSTISDSITLQQADSCQSAEMPKNVTLAW